jgi:MFS family permease
MNTVAFGARSRRWWILLVLCLSVLLVVVDNTIVNVALPTISRRLPASTQGLQWIVDAYTLLFAALLLVGGPGQTAVGDPPRGAGRATQETSPPGRVSR